MTTEERKLQRAQVQVELEDAQSYLNDLQIKATRWADALDEVSSKIRHNASLEPSKNDFDFNHDLQNRVNQAVQANLNYGEIVKLIEELKVARQKVVNLTRQKNQLASSGEWRATP